MRTFSSVYFPKNVYRKEYVIKSLQQLHLRQVTLLVFLVGKCWGHLGVESSSDAAVPSGRGPRSHQYRAGHVGAGPQEVVRPWQSVSSTIQVAYSGNHLSGVSFHVSSVPHADSHDKGHF